MRKVKDHYYKLAKEKDYSARSVFKLKEIDEKYRLIKKGCHILDLGASPGSWTEYSLERVGEKGLVVSVDLKPLRKPVLAHGHFIEGDIFQLTGEEFPDSVRKFNVVLSDMAPDTGGSKSVNHQLSLDLCRELMRVCDSFLKRDGDMVCKVFQGEDLQEYISEEVKPRFKSYKLFKPKSTRKESVELFIIGFGFIGKAE
ncbi:MAG: RlmE family RNA methyltransferase [Spirochaetota bacterium]|nr:RlmE family RNA methyltransferase [Spirochaetota bacterium]